MRFYTTENQRLQEKYYRGKHSSGLEVVIVPKAHKIFFIKKESVCTCNIIIYLILPV